MKPVAKNKIRATLRITKKNFRNKLLPHELFLTTQQNKTNKKNKIRNFTNSMSTEIKLRKVHLSKIIQSDIFLGNLMGNFGKKH